ASNVAPTAVYLGGAPGTAASIPENSPAGTAVGLLSTDDPDAGEVTTFALLSQADKFTLAADGKTLVVRAGAVLDFESTPSLAVDVRAADAAGHAITRPVAVPLTAVNEAPTAVYLGGAPSTGAAVPENSPAGTTVGVLATDDPDAGEVTTFALLSQADKFTLA